jgi:hypothetical protein
VIGRGAIILLLLAVWAGNGYAASTARWQGLPEAVRVGDALSVRLLLDLPDGAVPVWDEVAPDFGGLEAVASGDGGFTVYADLPGNYRLPAVRVPVTGADGSRTSLQAAALPYAVAAAFDPASPPSAPLPARGPLGVPFTWWPYAVLLAALAALAWRFLGRRPAPRVEAPAPVAEPVTPPDQAALARLARLVPGERPAREFFTELSEITRDYLEGRYRLPVRARTASEQIAVLSAAREPALVPLVAWLPDWELAKFARLDPGREAEAEALERVRAWVLASRIPEPAAGPADTGEVAS